MIDFRTHPDDYHHWRLSVDGHIARLGMDVDKSEGLGDYELKLNSYDLGVDIELADAVQRLRFEHPEVSAVLIESLQDRVFCAGANITMLSVTSHAGKVNFCKFTNETRLAIEDATENSGQRYFAAINGTAAGGGYELAMATDHIMLVDDGSAAVSLPEVPMLGVLPGTGGLTRLVDKRGVRHDRADVLCTTEEGVRGARAVRWGLVDEMIPRSSFEEGVAGRLAETVTEDGVAAGEGVSLGTLERTIADDAIEYTHLRVGLDRDLKTATITLRGPDGPPPGDGVAARDLGTAFWPLALARALDDALLHLRTNEPLLGTLLIESVGDLDAVAAHDAFLLEHADHWFVREVVLYWKRTLKRLDLTSRSLFAFVEPGSCFAGLLAEAAIGADRSYMLDDATTAAPMIRLSAMNDGPLTMGNGLTRIATRFWGNPDDLDRVRNAIGKDLDAATAENLGLVTFALDEIDWEDDVRLSLEERARFSPDSLTGMEANLRFAGPETMETKIFGRLTAWQNWVFTRDNASGEDGALRSYGTGQRPEFDWRRV